MRAGGSQELLPWASGHPSCPWGGRRRHSQPQGRGNRWEDLGTKKGGLCLNLKDSSPQDMHLPMCGCGGGPRAGRELVTFAGEPLHTGKATGTSRVCGGSSRNRDSVRLSIQAPVTCSTPALSMGTWAGPVATPGSPQEPTQGPPWCYPPHSACRAPQAAPPRGPHGVTHLAVLAGAPPGSPQGGAALSPQGGSAYVHLTAAILDLQPTGALGAVCRAGVTRSLGSPAGLTPAH